MHIDTGRQEARFDCRPENGHVVSTYIVDLDDDMGVAQIDGVCLSEVEMSCQVYAFEAGSRVRSAHADSHRRRLQQRTGNPYRAITGIGCHQGFESIDTTPGCNCMGKATQAVAADLGSTAVGVEEHELRGDSVIDSDDQAVGTDAG